MLTIADLKKHAEKLKGVTDEQLAFIESLSKEDEAVVKKTTRDNVTGELAQRIEDDFLEVPGIEKKPRESYYDYLKRGAKELKDATSGSSEKIKALETKVSDLEEAAKDKSGDPVLKKQLEDANKALKDEKSRVEALRTQLTDVEKKKEEEVEKVHGEYLLDSVRTKFEAKLANLTPRAGIDAEAFKELAKARFEKALTEATPEKYGNDIRFRKGDEVLKNPDNGQKDFTPEDYSLFLVKDLVAPERKAGGAGGSGSGGGGNSGGSGGGAYAGQARSKVEATDLINKALAQQGVTTSNPEFQTKFDTMWDEMGANDLPLRATEA